MDGGASRDWLSLAGRLQREADDFGVGRRQESAATAITGPRSAIDRFDDSVTSSALRAASRELFVDGHYARAVGEAFKCVNNEVKAKSGQSGLDGDKLMRSVFSANRPILALNALKSTSEKDEQRGYMEMFAGAMTGIRNPRAHEHLEDDASEALEMIVLANHLLRRLDSSVESL